MSLDLTTSASRNPVIAVHPFFVIPKTLSERLERKEDPHLHNKIIYEHKVIGFLGSLKETPLILFEDSSKMKTTRNVLSLIGKDREITEISTFNFNPEPLYGWSFLYSELERLGIKEADILGGNYKKRDFEKYSCPRERRADKNWKNKVHGCLTYTALDLLDKDYKVNVLEELTFDI